MSALEIRFKKVPILPIYSEKLAKSQTPKYVQI